MNRKWLLFLFAFCGCTKAPNCTRPAPRSRPPVPKAVIGPFYPKPVVAIYLVSEGQGGRARLLLRKTPSPRGIKALARVFDSDEKLILWNYTESVPEDTLAAWQPRPGIRLLSGQDPPAPGEVFLDEKFDLAEPGIYQARVSCECDEISVELELPGEMEWGVCFQNGRARPWPGTPKNAFVFVPPHAEKLELLGGPCAVTGPNGRELLRTARNGNATVPIERIGEVWKVTFSEPRSWELRAAGFPFILCSSKEAARRIHGSVEQLDDGTVVSHKFQRRIARLLPELLRRENVGVTRQLLVPLKSRKAAWLANPLRSLILKNSFLPAIPQWLERQNLNPRSHWCGSLDGWQYGENAGAPENRWDRLRGAKGLYAGASSHYGAAAEHLALAAFYDSPTNPYFGKKELLYRAAAAALRDLMVLAEDETFPGSSDLDSYPGNMAFVLGQKTLPVFARAAPHLPEPVRKVWTEALRHIIDRAYPDYLVSARNQSSHYLVAFQAFANGSQNSLYQSLSRLYASRWSHGQDPAGWHMEACGPDASYIGMTHWHEAVYYRMSRDPRILDSLRKSYGFFNHTVAPEPDGKMLGGFNFNHRVGEGFYFEQWGGAKGILDDVLPEVGIWAGPALSPDEKSAREKDARARLSEFLDDPKAPRYPDLTTWRYLYFSEPDRSGTFPCQETKPFIRDFAGQLAAIKRPGYYAYCFTGKPAGDFYIRQRENFRFPFPRNAEKTGGTINMRKITPFIGGGLSGFWTPAYGHFLLAANWSPTTHHGLIATRKDGKRYWEDYHAHTHELDKEKGTLTFRGRVESQPIRYVRTYGFGAEVLKIHLELEAEKDIELAGLVENVPVARGGWKARGAELFAAGQNRGDVRAASFRAADSRGAGVEVRLERPMPLHLVPDGLRTAGWRKLQIGRIEIVLPVSLKAGETFKLDYEFRPGLFK